MQFFALVAFFALLASRVLALDINITSLGTFSASQFLDISDTDLKNNCQDSCTTANNAINACTDDICLCNNVTVKDITGCQQCMFTDLIHRFATTQDPKAGSASALTAYASACNALNNSAAAVSAAQVALNVPSDWNGPFGQHLGVPATVIGVIIGSVLGMGCIAVVNSM